jgi:formylglycine-generating enzyme required for sulfatase activity
MHQQHRSTSTSTSALAAAFTAAVSFGVLSPAAAGPTVTVTSHPPLQVTPPPYDFYLPVEYRWVSLAGGSFLMGAPGSNPPSWWGPLHWVNVPAFQLMKTEVTVDQYYDCMLDGACGVPGTDPTCTLVLPDNGDLPIDCVSQDDARAFCEWYGARLPSEAEWEYAARSRGQFNRIYPWGGSSIDDIDCDRAVYHDNTHGAIQGCGLGHAAPVCSRPEGNTDQGICDMAGNVEEWVEDDYHDSYVGAPADGSAWLDPTPSDKGIARGGAFWLSAYEQRVYVRSYNWADLDSGGIRCAR